MTQLPWFDRHPSYAWLLGGLMIAMLLMGSWASYELAGQYAMDLFANLATLVCALGLVMMIGLRAFVGNVGERGEWLLLAGGLFLWLVAECIWAYSKLALRVELPYPSLADFVWIVGYLPLIWAFWLRFRALSSRLPTRQLIASLIVFLPTLGLLFLFVVYPILVAPAGDRPLEKALNLVYPILDLVLIFTVLLTALVLGRGPRSKGWLVMLAGLVLMCLLDISFSYATWNGHYYPGGALNAISFLLDSLYPVFYLGISAGAYFEYRYARSG